MASPALQKPLRLVASSTITALVCGVLIAVNPAGPALATSGVNPYVVPLVVDTNPDPNIVETTIIAKTATVNIGNGVMAKALTYNGQIPGP